MQIRTSYHAYLTDYVLEDPITGEYSQRKIGYPWPRQLKIGIIYRLDGFMRTC